MIKCSVNSWSALTCQRFGRVRPWGHPRMLNSWFAIAAPGRRRTSGDKSPDSREVTQNGRRRLGVKPPATGGPHRLTVDLTLREA